MKLFKKFTIFACLFLQAKSVLAEEVEKPRVKKDDKSIFSVVWENDALSGADKGYTNGVRFAYISSEEQAPKFFRHASNYLPMFAKNGKKRIGIAVGQNMYTPSNIETQNPDSNDHPYAGWLYGSFGMFSDTGKTLDNVVITLGMVGPAARAEPTQKFIHKNFTDSAKPQGWNNQLKDEPGVVLTYERKWREVFSASRNSAGFDMMPHVGIDLGNVYTDASMGATFRLGYDLPVDYGPPRIRPSLPGSDFFVPVEKISGYLFSTAELRAVGRNIFLDGNTFQESSHVHKKTMVGTLQIGGVVIYKETRISLTRIFVTREYAGPHGNGVKFDALTLSWRF
ncbi:MAG: lipid A deacylase LpxR family protein [Pseudomonadota bacterium]